MTSKKGKGTYHKVSASKSRKKRSSSSKTQTVKKSLRIDDRIPFTVYDYLTNVIDNQIETITEKELKDYLTDDDFVVIRDEDFAFIYFSDGQVPEVALDEQLKYNDTKIFWYDEDFDDGIDESDIDDAFEIATNPSAVYGGWATLEGIYKVI